VCSAHLEEVSNSPGPGNVVSVELEMESHREVFTAFGEKGVPARRVADDVVRQTRDYLAAGQPVGAHLADQLMIPLALAAEGSYRTGPPSRHSLTNAEVVNAFLGERLGVREVERRVWLVAARP
jgi:RNA 3'-terminal phosphate cyclase (ATP)